MHKFDHYQSKKIIINFYKFQNLITQLRLTISLLTVVVESHGIPPMGLRIFNRRIIILGV